MASGPYKSGMTYNTYKPGNVGCSVGLLPESRQSPPDKLRASAGASGTIDLTWLPDASADSYKLYQGESHNGQSAIPAAEGLTGTTYQVTGLISGQEYFFKLKALGLKGLSLPSNEASVVAL